MSDSGRQAWQPKTLREQYDALIDALTELEKTYRYGEVFQVREVIADKLKVIREKHRPLGGG